MDAHDEPHGDAACWLSELCAECGAITEDPSAQQCWRCGSPLRTPDAR